MASTTSHLKYLRGYIDLGMVNEASDELEAIDWDDRMRISCGKHRKQLDRPSGGCGRNGMRLRLGIGGQGVRRI